MSTMNIYDLTDTWNAGGTTFNAIKMNVTDTASAAASLLMDLQVGGVSRFSIRKDGATTVATKIAGGGFTLGENGSGAITVRATGLYGWSNDNTGSTAYDLTLARDAADTLAQRNGTNAQAFRIYNTFTDASNYERGSVGWAGNAFVIATENAGTGSNRPVLLQGRGNATVESVLGSVLIRTSSANRWSVDPNGHFLAAVDNTHDIGASGANRPRYLYLGGGSLTGSQADSSLTVSPTWNTTGTPTAIKMNVTDTASAAGSLLLDLQVGGSSRFQVAKNGAFSATGAISVWTGTAVGAGNQVIHLNPSSQMIAVASTGQFSFGATTNAGSTQDVILARDAANTLAQRNGTSAQTFRLYNTYTDASNYERLNIWWSANTAFVETLSAGTGTARNLSIGTNGASTRVTLFTAGTNRWRVDGNGHFTAEADNTYDIGASGATRPRNVFWAGYQEMSEVTAPAAPAANGVRIYAVDNGSGKTQLMALFATGAAQQIAIEP